MTVPSREPRTTAPTIGTAAATTAATVTMAQATRLQCRCGEQDQRRIDGGAELRCAHELRETSNDLFGGIADGADDVSEHWARLRRCRRRAQPRDRGEG